MKYIQLPLLYNPAGLYNLVNGKLRKECSVELPGELYWDFSRESELSESTRENTSKTMMQIW